MRDSPWGLMRSTLGADTEALMEKYVCSRSDTLGSLAKQLNIWRTKILHKSVDMHLYLLMLLMLMKLYKCRLVCSPARMLRAQRACFIYLSIWMSCFHDITNRLLSAYLFNKKKKKKTSRHSDGVCWHLIPRTHGGNVTTLDQISAGLYVP